MTVRTRLKAAGKGLITSGVIIAVTLLILDGILIVLGLFPPPTNPGHPEVGWVANAPSGEMTFYECMELDEGSIHRIQLNEAGHRTSRSVAEFEGPGELFEIAVSGDSHTDLCAPNAETHFGFMEASLSEQGLPAAAFSYGSGRYSPLQAYLAVAGPMRDYEVDAFVLNLYTGNDFYDILRIDDRPHLVPDGDGYRVEPPVWYTLDSPDRERKSRVLYFLSEIGRRTGVGNMIVRLRYLREAAGRQGQGVGSILRYVNDLRRSTSEEVGYPGAFAAQILNQQLFFYRFPGTREESLRQIESLLGMIREAHPDVTLVMSPIPSYQLVGREPIDGAFLRVLERLPLTQEEGMAFEEALYEELRARSERSGWLFVDNLESLRSYEGPDNLFNRHDYHVTPAASRLVGEAQARAILSSRSGEGG